MWKWYKKAFEKKIKKKFTKCWLLKKKLYLCTRKKVRKNNFANEIVKGPDKLNVRGFYIVSECKSVLWACNGFSKISHNRGCNSRNYVV